MRVIIALVSMIAFAALFVDPSTVDPSTIITDAPSIIAEPFGLNSSLMLIGAVSVVSPLEPLIVSVVQAAKALSVSRAQMYVLVKKGHFKLIKIPGAGKRSGILVSDLKRYVSECAAASAPDDKAPPAPKSDEPSPAASQPAVVLGAYDLVAADLRAASRDGEPATRAEKPPPHRRTRQQLKKEDHGTYEKKSAGQEQMCSSPALQCDGPWQGEIANGKRRSHDCNKSSPSRLQRPSATSTRQSPQNMEGFGSWLITQLCRSSQMRTLQTVILPSPWSSMAVTSFC